MITTFIRSYDVNANWALITESICKHLQHPIRASKIAHFNVLTGCIYVHACVATAADRDLVVAPSNQACGLKVSVKRLLRSDP